MRVSLKRFTSAASVVDFPEPDGPQIEHEPLVIVGDLREMRRQPELDDRRRLLGDDAEDGVVAAMIEEDVGAVAAALRDDVAEVDLVHASPASSHCFSVSTSFSIASVCAAVNGSPCARSRSAASRTIGGWPTARWKSDAP